MLRWAAFVSLSIYALERLLLKFIRQPISKKNNGNYSTLLQDFPNGEWLLKVAIARQSSLRRAIHGDLLEKTGVSDQWDRQIQASRSFVIYSILDLCCRERICG